MSNRLEVILEDVATKNIIRLSLDEDKLVVVKTGLSKQVPLKNVLQCAWNSTERVLRLDYVARRDQKGHFVHSSFSGPVKDGDGAEIQVWAESVMLRAYADVKPGRRLKVIVNPHGGVGKGVQIFATKVEPILRAGNCILDVTETTHHRHAYEIAKDLPLDFDALICVSGDGLIHEVLNGFIEHEYPAKAFKLPLAPIPTGSGNGLSLNLLGLEDGFDVCLATLNAVKGLPMKVDVCGLYQNGKHSLSYMSQAVGLFADLDLGTESLRWMGDGRFVFGYIRGVLQMRACPVELSYKPVELDKRKIVEALEHETESDETTFTEEDEAIPRCRLPGLKYAKDDTDGWLVYDKPILTVLAGKGPYVGRDLMAFPASRRSDGLLDMSITPTASRTDLLMSLNGGPKGEHFWSDVCHYIKAHAYRVRPLATNGYLAVDGEQFPFEEYQVEVHPKLASFLSLYGHYAADFNATIPPKFAEQTTI